MSAVVNLDLFETAGLSVVVLFLGMQVKKALPVLETYCIPSPVVGGLISSVCLSLLYFMGVKITLDDAMSDLFMMFFFTTIGFQVNLRLLMESFVSLLGLLFCVILLLVAQNLLAVGVSAFTHTDALLALTTGSLSMLGGSGMGEAFGPVLEDLTLKDGTSLCYAASTFGLVVGALLGGPMGRFLILRYQLKPDLERINSLLTLKHTAAESAKQTFAARLARAFYQLIIAMGIGMGLADLLEQSGLRLPDYLLAMVVAMILRNISEYTHRFNFQVAELSYLGGLCLSMFLGIDFASIALWQLGDLAVGQLLPLLLQIPLVLLFAFLMFKLSGADYDAALIGGASCGFGLGVSSCGISSILVLAGKYGYSIKAYILVPLVGTVLADLLNSYLINYLLRLV